MRLPDLKYMQGAAAGLACAVGLAFLFAGGALQMVHAQDQAPSEQGARLSGGRPKFGPPPGMQAFQQHCATCHTAESAQGRAAPSRSALGAMPPQTIYQAMASGAMREQAAGLNDAAMKQVAEFLAGRKLIDAQAISAARMSNRCTMSSPMGDPAASGAWNGWSAGTGNARFQASAGLSSAEVPRLKLKWAFGLPGGASNLSQPTIAGGRVFVGSDNTAIYALDAKTGCVYWSFLADAAGRFAPVVAPIHGHGASRYGVFFATSRGSVYALDADDGKLLWKTVLARPASISASSAYAAGRLYVPITGSETVAGANPDYACCTSRGGVASLDADTGKLVWRADSIAEPLRKLGTNPAGKQMWGPSGASVWNTPTIDARRGVLYVGTGNSFGPVAAATSDSVLAMRLSDGKILWHHQEVRDDAFMLGCPDVSAPGGNCPAKIGPDWDFGGASIILETLPDGRDMLLAAGKAGIAVGLDPDHAGKLLWRTKLFDGAPPTADGLVLFGAAADGSRVYYPLQQPGGGLMALDIASGKRLWSVGMKADGRGQIGPASAIPGAVFTGGWDGVLRAVGPDGGILWRVDTKREFDTINGVKAHGGSLGSTGPTIAGGMVLVSSGYIGMQNGSPGNVLLAFAPQ